jgi:hypothetical protein
MTMGVEVAAYLAAEGHGTVGTDIFENDMPDVPVELYVVFEYAGSLPLRTQEIPGIAYERPRGQVQCRAATRAAGRANIEKAFKSLDHVGNQTLTGTRYVSIDPLQSPFLLSTNAQDESIFVFNFECVKDIS